MCAPSTTRNAPDSGVKFTAASLAKSSKTAPSTNHPVVCPACHPDLAEDAHQISSAAPSKKRKAAIPPAVWSYNMKAHWRRLHNSTDMPLGLEDALKLGESETNALESL
jgi:hypothetical protein